MDNKTDIIAQSLGIDVPTTPTKIAELIPQKKMSANGNDFEYARRNTYDVIERGMSALDDIIDIAKQSESARAFEVATNLMKTMLDANKDLMDLNKSNKELNRDDRTPDKQVTNNNLFVGSSADLLKMLKNSNEPG
jgi:hypothetical protein